MKGQNHTYTVNWIQRNGEFEFYSGIGWILLLKTAVGLIEIAVNLSDIRYNFVRNSPGVRHRQSASHPRRPPRSPPPGYATESRYNVNDINHGVMQLYHRELITFFWHIIIMIADIVTYLWHHYSLFLVYWLHLDKPFWQMMRGMYVCMYDAFFEDNSILTKIVETTCWLKPLNVR